MWIALVVNVVLVVNIFQAQAQSAVDRFGGAASVQQFHQWHTRDVEVYAHT